MQQFVSNVRKIKNNFIVILLRYLVVVVVFFGHLFLKKMLPVSINKGISLGINITGMNRLILCLLVLVVYKLFRRFDWRLWFIFVGGLVNTIERLQFGYVSDYFNFGLVYNNLPDLLIFIGVIWFFIDGSKNKN